MKSRFILRDDRVKRRAQQAISELSTDGEPYEVTIKPYHKSRSLEQNDLMWAYHQAASEELGHTPKEMHAICCSRLMGNRIVGGEPVPITTTCGPDGNTLNVKEMATFITQVEELYVSLGIRLDKVHGQEKEKAETGQPGPT